MERDLQIFLLHKYGQDLTYVNNIRRRYPSEAINPQ